MTMTDPNFNKMKLDNNNEQRYMKAQKRVKDIKGFYTHLFVTVFIIPFWIFINLELAPQFHWFWIAIMAWFVGIFIHWLGVFGFSKLSYRKDWEQKKFREIMGEDKNSIESNYTQEQFYIQAKKRMKEIKGFYIHLIVELFAIAIIVFVNLKFVPGFHFFWYAVLGILMALFFHWMGVFGFAKFGLGKNWEEKKIKELMDDSNRIKL
tara:strand:- start:104273 stop:104893 length:621 start_codon:yes stop_codon:yes gene_type:complete